MITINRKKTIQLTIGGSIVDASVLVSYIDISMHSQFPVTKVLIITEGFTTILDVNAMMKLKQLTEVVVLNSLTDVNGTLSFIDADGTVFNLWKGVLVGRERTLIYGDSQRYWI